MEQNNVAENENFQQQQQARQIAIMKRMLLRKGMSIEARERLGRVRAANPELAEKAEIVSIQFIQQGKSISDEVLVEILNRLTPKREIRITRR